jgi:hypothetical protein
MTDELPPLPKETEVNREVMGKHITVLAYSSKQMQDYARAAIAAHEARKVPLEPTLTENLIHDLSSHWVYIVPGRESEQYEELKDFAKAVELAVKGRVHEALELDTSDCDECCGKGWNWEEHQVAERKSDIQEFKSDCTACDGRGFVGPDAARRAAILASAPQASAAHEAKQTAEPVAHLFVGGSYGDELEDWELDPENGVCDKLNEAAYAKGKKDVIPLYTHPQPAKREPLSDEQIESILQAEISADPGDGCASRFARAVEAAHGITKDTP